MAKHGRRQGINAIPFSQTLTLGTLGAGTAIETVVLTTSREFFAVSADAEFAMEGHTATEGPIQVGFAQNDLSATEILEKLDANMATPDDIIAKERSRRPVRSYGRFPGLDTNEVLSDGDAIRRPWKFSIGEVGFNMWAVNRDGAALTTGTNVRVSGTLFGRWTR